jgi:hypothetical protein
MEIQGNHENKENNGIETQSHVGSILSQSESTNTKSQKHSSLQDPHHRGLNVTPRKYFIPKINMRKFDGKYPITWIFYMEQCWHKGRPRVQRYNNAPTKP